MEIRSPVRWADRITAPVLILQGGADPAVAPAHALELARRMDEAGNLFELIVYAREIHEALNNRRDRDARIVGWFRRYLR